MSPFISRKVYGGIDRRSSSDRRAMFERRNLIRYESVGSNRRVDQIRRKEDMFWLAQKL